MQIQLGSHLTLSIGRLALVVVVFFLLLLMLLQWQAQSQAQKSLERQLGLQTQLSLLATRMQQLPKPGGYVAETQLSQTQLQQILMRQGGIKAEFQAQGTGRFQVDLTSIEFNKLLRIVTALQRNNIELDKAEVKALDKQGWVSARLQLVRPSA